LLQRILIAGLGNPGQKYKNTRHNIGFMVLDSIAGELGLSFREDRRGPGFASAEADVQGVRILLAKPLEYMNRSGPPLERLRSFYKIDPDDLLVVHDDLDINLGRFKFVRSGGAGGHNGVHSIIQALGTDSFPRLKIGIDRPPPGMPADRYVLGRFPPEQKALLAKVIQTASDAVLFFAGHGIDEAMNRFNGICVGT